jgi:hypothetical protein
MTEPHWARAVARVWRGHTFAADTFRGSGFQFAPHCLLTARHVTFDCEGDLYVSGPSWTGIRKVVKVVEHSNRDIALLFIDGFQSSQGWVLHPVMNPETFAGSSIRGSLAGYADHRTDVHIREAVWQSYYGLTNTVTLSTPVAKGMSGGPFVVSNKAFGVIQGRREIEAVTYVIPLSAIADFVRAHVPNLETAVHDRASGARVFVQILNPEMLRLHGREPDVRGIERVVDVYFRYAFILASDCVIMPASYLFEVTGLSDFLRPLEPLIAEGALQLANPTLSLDSYWDLKQKKEYRDRAVYGSKPEFAINLSLPIIPRIWRSTARDISTSWLAGVGNASSWFRDTFERLAREGGQKPELIEYLFTNLPILLDNRAFIREFVENVLRIPLTPHERLQLAYFLSREYLLSYLREYRALILNDTTLGRFDCGLPLHDPEGDRSRLTVSLRELMALFERLGVRSAFESLSWDGIRSLRHQPIIHRFSEAVAQEGRLAFRAATQMPVGLKTTSSDRHAIDHILEALTRFFSGQ